MGDISHTGGKVGIGTDAPSCKLELKGASGVDSELRITSTTANSSGKLSLYENANTAFEISSANGRFYIKDSFNNGERLSITNNGNVGIGTIAPGATLDVAGTLRVGNFGGSTNVMPKTARVSSAGVGHVVPLFTWSTTFGSAYETFTQTTPLPQGKWFVHFTSSVDSTVESENPHGVMAHVWDVPASKWLTFATVGNANVVNPTSSTSSGVFWNIHDSLGTLRSNTLTPADIIVANGWTEFVRATSGGGDAGGNCYSLGNQNSEDSTKYGFVYNNKWFKPVHICGYAIRIA